MAVRLVETEGMSVGFSDDINRPGDSLHELRRLAAKRDKARDAAEDHVQLLLRAVFPPMRWESEK